MNLSLAPDLEQFISNKIKSGQYSSASEVVSEALQLLKEQDASRGTRLAEFNDEIRHRLSAIDGGECVQPADARQRLAHKSQARRTQPR